MIAHNMKEQIIELRKKKKKERIRMSKSNWTNKQVEAMMELAEAGLTLEDASAAMINTGWEKRTVPSLRMKYRSHTGTKWPMKIDLAVEEDFPVNMESPGTNWMPLVMIGLGLMIAGYTWWSL